MGAKKIKTLLSDADIISAWGVTTAWIDQRTGPKARRSPKLPTVDGFKPRKFDPDVIAEIQSRFCKSSSLKTKEAGKNVVGNKTLEKGVYKPLW